MHVEITEQSVLVVKKDEDNREQVSFFNLLNEFYKSEQHNVDNLGRIEIAQQFFYDIALFIKEGEYDNEEIEDDDTDDSVSTYNNRFLPESRKESFPVGGLPDHVFG